MLMASSGCFSAFAFILQFASALTAFTLKPSAEGVQKPASDGPCPAGGVLVENSIQMWESVKSCADLHSARPCFQESALLPCMPQRRRLVSFMGPHLFHRRQRSFWTRAGLPVQTQRERAHCFNQVSSITHRLAARVATGVQTAGG